MIKRIFYSISSVATLILNIKHLSVSQWDVEESECTQRINGVRQQR
ncbi:MAG: hypothetical protein ACI9YH_000430 [Colwellia sp.]|jgi:hypothetical protein